jgi:hypothetical protein
MNKGELRRWIGVDDDFFIILGPHEEAEDSKEAHRYLSLDTGKEDWHYKTFLFAKSEKVG